MGFSERDFLNNIIMQFMIENSDSKIKPDKHHCLYCGNGNYITKTEKELGKYECWKCDKENELKNK